MSASTSTLSPPSPVLAGSRLLIIAVVVLAAITPSLLMTAPAVAAQLASQWHLAPAQIGNLFMAELGAMTVVGELGEPCPLLVTTLDAMEEA